MCACVRARVVYYVTLPKLDENGSIDRSAARLNVVPAEQTASGLIRGCSTERCYTHKCYDIRYRRRQQSIAAATGDRRRRIGSRVETRRDIAGRRPAEWKHRPSRVNKFTASALPINSSRYPLHPQITTQNNGGLKARSTPAT